MIKEFKEFVMKGNVLDMAVGIIIGAAFGKVVTSFVSDVLMPPVGLLLGKVDFSNLFINLSGKTFESLADANGLPDILKVKPVLYAPEVRNYYGVGSLLGQGHTIGKEL